MNRIDNLFENKQSGITSVYYPAGFPQRDDTLVVLAELESKGVDLVELGIPFSDPMADGVVIQEAATQALRNGMSVRLLFEQLEALRPAITIPVVLMGYLNPIMHYGFEAFCEACRRVGVDGLIIPDLPFQEYMDHYKATAERYGIKMIMFITPETSDERIRLVDSHTSGFIYMVSVAGTTGEQSSFDAQQSYFERIEAMTLRHPRLIGFGISNYATFAAACRHAQGAIVGSHFVRLLATHPSISSAVDTLMTELIDATPNAVEEI